MTACYVLVVALVTGGGISWLRDAKLGRPTTVFDYARMMGKRLPELASPPAGSFPIAMLGDSSLVSYPAGKSVPEQLSETLERSDDMTGVEVHSLGMSGTGPFDYYFLSDRIAAAKPRLVVVALNLDHFSRAWLGAYARPQLAGLIAASHLPEALVLPLFRAGLTTDRLLFYNAVVGFGGYEPWYWLTLRQAQVGRARDRVERWLGGSPDYRAHEPPPSTAEELFRVAARDDTISRVFTGADIHRYRLAAMREHYGVSLRGVTVEHPALQVLRATLSTFHASGIDTLVYIAPVDVAYMKEIGVFDARGLERTISASRQVVEEAGSTFLDMHDVFPTGAFRDAPGHLVFEGHERYDELDGPSELAARLAPAVEARVRAHRESAPVRDAN